MANLFDDDTINRVWQKGTVVPNYKAELYRKDACGAWMMRSEYGSESSLGWQIDHVYPVAKGGDDTIENLRPMQHQNNRSKGDNYPIYTGVIKAEGNNNIDKEGQYTINAALQETLNNLYKLR
nr:HNH endonuclease signature motif containing protein [uncultured Macellibacteroides sp.]